MSSHDTDQVQVQVPQRSLTSIRTPQRLGADGQVAQLSASDGRDGVTELAVTADQPMRFLLFSGRPLQEPVVSYGPFVMNTREQIIQAFQDFQAGRFGPVPERAQSVY